jgi:hypothetical protein
MGLSPGAAFGLTLALLAGAAVVLVLISLLSVGIERLADRLMVRPTRPEVLRVKAYVETMETPEEHRAPRELEG